MSLIYGTSLGMCVGSANVNTSFPAISLDFAFTYETGGDAWAMRFVNPVAQSAGTLTVHVFVSTILGSPTDVRAAVYNGPGTADDQDRPEAGGSPLATSGAVDLSGTTGTWVTFTITGVTLVAGQTYYVIIDNRTGTPGTNYPRIRYQGFFNRFNATWLQSHTRALYTTDGFTSDPTAGTGYAPCVLKFDDGTLYGLPYVELDALASSTDDVGNRYAFEEDVTVVGASFKGNNNYTGFEINEAVGGANVLTATIDRYARLDAGAIVFSPPVRLKGGRAYDCVITRSVAGTWNTGYMGEASGALPADVLACRMNGMAAVHGATPGSYTLDTARLSQMAILLDNNPAQATNLLHGMLE